VRPLRLYFNRGHYRKAENEDVVGIVINVKLDALWMQGNYGDQKTLLSSRLLVDKIDLSQNRQAHYYLNNDQAAWSKLPYHPSVPFSVDTQHRRIAGELTALTITVAEAGKVPLWLKQLADAFHDNKDKLSANIKDAIEKAAK